MLGFVLLNQRQAWLFFDTRDRIAALSVTLPKNIARHDDTRAIRVQLALKVFLRAIGGRFRKGRCVGFILARQQLARRVADVVDSVTRHRISETVARSKRSE